MFQASNSNSVTTSYFLYLYVVHSIPIVLIYQLVIGNMSFTHVIARRKNVVKRPLRLFLKYDRKS